MKAFAPITPARDSTLLNWQSVFGDIEVLTGNLNDVTIIKETVPIIFLPGIMGTRLKNKDEIVWDPDDMLRFGVKYGLCPLTGSKSKRQYLIGDVGHKDNYLGLINNQTPLNSPKKGWDNLVKQCYTNIQSFLASDFLTPSAALCFKTPAYAFGFNWTSSPETSGDLLAEFILNTLAHHKKDGPCRHVIIITHSMGGLVARAAAKLHGADASILGIIHTVQPASGAPVTYSRMKTGYIAKANGTNSLKDRQIAWCLGRNGKEITATMGNMPGGLSLLPNHLYQSVSKDPAWLMIGDGTDALPRYGNPYDEIYRNRTHAWALIDEKRLNPAGRNPEADWQNYLILLNDVEQFHRRLGAAHHANSHHIIGDSLPTPVQGTYSARVHLPHDQPAVADPSMIAPVQHIASLQDERLKNLCLHYKWGSFAATGRTVEQNDINVNFDAQARPDGDGTVPVNSAASILDDTSTCTLVPNLDHGDAMQDPRVLALIRDKINGMLHDVIYREVGP
jgi:pimeloyl-ACP methyl ester carboxylesterase